jgi:DnaJ family protein C protein 17
MSKKGFPEQDPYEVLGLSPSAASDADVAKAYRKLALQLHPDKATQGLSKAEQDRNAHKFQEIQQARSFLLDAEHREAREKYVVKRASEELRRQADAARDKGMSERRKRMREELKREEQRSMATSRRRGNDGAKVEELRRQGNEMREAYAHRAAEKSVREASKDQSDRKRLLEDRQIRLKWSRKKMTTSPSEHSIATLLSKFGTVELVEMLGSKGNSGLVTFKSPDSCRPCVDDYAESNEMRASFVGKRKEREEQAEEEKDKAEIKSTTTRRERESVDDWKLRRAAEREHLLRDMEKEDGSGVKESSTSKQPKKKKRATHHLFPPPFSSIDGNDKGLSALEKLEQAEASILKDLLPAETLQRIRLAS